MQNMATAVVSAGNSSARIADRRSTVRTATAVRFGIRIGSIDQRQELVPKKQIWCRSALPGVENVETLPRFEGED